MSKRRRRGGRGAGAVKRRQRRRKLPAVQAEWQRMTEAEFDWWLTEAALAAQKETPRGDANGV